LDIDIKQTVHVKDYGAIPDTGEPQGENILDAIMSAVEMGEGTRVLFDPGVYYINAPKIIGDHNRNTVVSPDQALYHLFISNAHGLIIDGNGAALIFEDYFAGAFKFDRCDGVSLINMTIDYKEAPWTQGEVISVDSASMSFEYRVYNDATDLLSDTRMVGAINEKKFNDQVFGMVMDQNNPVLLKKSSNDYFFISGYEKTGDRLYRVYVDDVVYLNPNFIDTGDKITLNNRGVAGSAIDVINSDNIYKKRDCLRVALYRYNRRIRQRRIDCR